MSHKYVLLVFLCLLYAKSLADNAEYLVNAENPSSNTYRIEVKISDFQESDTLILKMATWTPGSYKIREFAKNVSKYCAVNSSRDTLKSFKIDKNTWGILVNSNKEIYFSYSVYAHELSVRTNFLDNTLGLINGAGLFIYPQDYNEYKFDLKFDIPDSWVISTTLNSKSKNQFSAENLDHLFDSPILLGTQEEIKFKVDGVNHRVALIGQTYYDAEIIKNDLSKIIQYQTGIFKDKPNKEYLFIVISRSNRGGGLEHKNSSTLIINRYDLIEASGYRNFLSLAAHEYFHLWNVKRLRANTLGPFDYEKENYTDLLWVFEGFTSYYSNKTLYQIGERDQNSFIQNISSKIESDLERPGKKIQSLSESSMDAWIKFYISDENDFNSTISYYNSGMAMAALLEMKIIKDSNGDKNLDDLMSLLYVKYFKEQGRGFSSQELLASINELTGKDYQKFFDKYINSPEIAPLKEIMEPFGFLIEKEISSIYDIGLNIKNDDEHYVVASITDGSDSRIAGFNVNDEIISIEGYRFDNRKLNFYKKIKLVGEEINFIIIRDDKVMDLKMLKSHDGSTKYNIVLKKDLKEIENKWLIKFISRN